MEGREADASVPTGSCEGHSVLTEAPPQFSAQEENNQEGVHQDVHQEEEECCEQVEETREEGHTAEGGGGEGGEPPRKKHRGGRQQRERAARAAARAAGLPVPSRRAVYVSGMPTDTTEAELAAFCARCGLVRKDGAARPCVRLYRTPAGVPKGDGTATYLQAASVDLALLVLDGAEYRPGVRVHVTRAEFVPKSGSGSGGQNGANSTKTDKMMGATTAIPTKKERRYDQRKQELGWGEGAADRHVVLRHMFGPEDAARSGDVAAWTAALREDVRAEAARHGAVRCVRVFPGHADGVVVVKFANTLDAQRCIDALDGRYFAGRRVSAAPYDGFTDFAVAEDIDARERRIDAWHKYLDDGGSGEEDGDGGNDDDYEDEEKGEKDEKEEDDKPKETETPQD